MISVTGYYKGKPLVYGRAETEVEAIKNAKAYAAQACSQFPRLDDPSCWTFERDVCDRQVFAPAKHLLDGVPSEAAIAAKK